MVADYAYTCVCGGEIAYVSGCEHYHMVALNPDGTPNWDENYEDEDGIEGESTGNFWFVCRECGEDVVDLGDLPLKI